MKKQNLGPVVGVAFFHIPHMPGCRPFFTPLSRGGSGGWFSRRERLPLRTGRDLSLRFFFIISREHGFRWSFRHHFQPTREGFTPPLRGSRRSRAFFAKADAVGGDLFCGMSPHRFGFGFTPSPHRLPLKGGVNFKSVSPTKPSLYILVLCTGSPCGATFFPIKFPVSVERAGARL